MKVKITLTLTQKIVRYIDEIAGKPGNRSRVIQRAIAEYVVRGPRVECDVRDREIFHRYADELNDEMGDVLGYQVAR